ncbi:hypothetical protein EB118_14805 [bacterium]|nr:hypothetical protein [bacterium]
MAQSITLQTSDNNVQESDVLGRLSFAASSESSGSDAILIGASIYAMAESDFTEIANATSIIFATSTSESAVAKLKISSQGHFLPLLNKTYDIGASGAKFRNIYAENGKFENVNISNLSDPYEILYITDSGGSVSSTDLLKVDITNSELELDGNIVGTGDINIDGNLTVNSGNFTSLKVNNIGVSVSGHSHTSYDITNFNSSISGILPVKDIISGSGISIGATSGIYTITAEGVAASSASSLVTRCSNRTGSTIPKMTAVYINGGNGNLPTITPAQANNEANSSKTYGITQTQISDNNTGNVVVFGALIDVNTNQFGANEGDVLYLSPTVAGGITATKPSAPNHMVSVGKIVRNHNNQGIIEVVIQNGFELQELHNVAINGVTNGQFLQYNSTSGLWLASSSGNFTSLSVNNTGVSISGHSHLSSDISDFNSAVVSASPEEVLEYATSSDFPASGIISNLYISTDYSKAYRWSGNSYVEIGPSPLFVANHTHSSSDITNFNSSVSGLLPVTNIVSVNNITVNNNSGIFTIGNSGLVNSNISGIVGATNINNLVKMSEANYNNLETKDPNTVYFIV